MEKAINNRYHILIYQMGRVVERYPVKIRKLAQQEFEMAVELCSKENFDHITDVSYRRFQKVVLVDLSDCHVMLEKLL